MKKIGIIGGLSCESSAEYYLRITRKSNEYLGDHQTVQVMMISVNTGDIINSIHDNNWHKATSILVNASRQLEKMGADCIIIPCNTLHKVAEEVQRNISIPLLNIMNCVGDYIKKNSYQKVALLGTKFTMEDTFYRDYLYNNFNIETDVPNKIDREILHEIIFNELCRGKIKHKSRLFLIDLCRDFYIKNNCQAMILGCSEIPLLIKQDDVNVDLIDTIDIHSDYAVKFAINKYLTIKKVA